MATGAESLVAELERLGIRVAFGLPGVHNLPIWTALADSPIRMVGVRHEQTAVYAADGYARTTGELGVAIATTGPGAVNAAAATGEAFASRSPVLVIATDIAKVLQKPGVMRGALHETRDQRAVFAPLTVETFRADEADRIAETVAAAAARALRPPTGPVFLEIPTDLLSARVNAAAPGPSTRGAGDPPTADEGGAGGSAGEDRGAGNRVAEDPDDEALRRAVEAMAAAERPLIWVGGGAARSPGAREAIERLAEDVSAPVLETYSARGLISLRHPCRVGLPPHVPEAGRLWDEADVVVAIGSDLDGMNTQNWQQPQPPILIAINVDENDATKNYRVDVSLVGDAAALAGRLADACEEAGGKPARALGLAELRELALRRLSDEEPRGLELVDTVGATWPEGAPIVCDMCIPGYWIAGFLPLDRPARLVYPMGWGTLGFGFPAAIGAALGTADTRTLCIVGDGGFMFAPGELATAKQEAVSLTILLTDDGGYGMLDYDFRVAHKPAVGVDLFTPEWSRLAAAFDIPFDVAADTGQGLASLLARHLDTEGPSMILYRGRLLPPPTTSPRWYRNAAPNRARD